MASRREQREELNKELEEARKDGMRIQLNECLLSLINADGAEDLKTLEQNIIELIYDWQSRLKEEYNDSSITNTVNSTVHSIDGSFVCRHLRMVY